MYRHGFCTREAIAERRLLRALVKGLAGRCQNRSPVTSACLWTGQAKLLRKWPRPPLVAHDPTLADSSDDTTAICECWVGLPQGEPKCPQGQRAFSLVRCDRGPRRRQRPPATTARCEGQRLRKCREDCPVCMPLCRSPSELASSRDKSNQKIGLSVQRAGLARAGPAGISRRGGSSWDSRIDRQAVRQPAGARFWQLPCPNALSLRSQPYPRAHAREPASGRNLSR
jgi:hypothetical protein